MITTKAVFLLMFMVYGDKPSMTTQEFLSETACEKAALIVKRLGSSHNFQSPNAPYTAFCVPKE